MKRALITGVNGQDGSYLSQLLLKHNYEVVGTVRNNKSSLENLKYLKILSQIHIYILDLLDYREVENIFNEHTFDEVYNLAGISSVSYSFLKPLETINTNTNILLNILEVIKNISPSTKLYQASSSEMFGEVSQLPINGSERFNPVSPYGVSKVSCYYLTEIYKKNYKLYISNGILFNHESYLRKDNFFIKKLIKSTVLNRFNNNFKLEVGNIEVHRDFGYAPLYVEAMFKMLQQKEPDNFVVSSGENMSLKEIIYYVFKKFNIPKESLIINPKLYRPNEIQKIYGNNEKTKIRLNWSYDLTIPELIDLLIKEELENNHHQKNH